LGEATKLTLHSAESCQINPAFPTNHELPSNVCRFGTLIVLIDIFNDRAPAQLSYCENSGVVAQGARDERRRMAEHDDFGQLYRAALAETDPEKKSRLLQEVQLILLRWQQQAITSALAEHARFDRTHTDSAA